VKERTAKEWTREYNTLRTSEVISCEWETSEKMENVWSWNTLPKRIRSPANHHSKIYLPVNRDHRLGQLGLTLIDLLDGTSSRRLRRLMSGLRATISLTVFSNHACLSMITSIKRPFSLARYFYNHLKCMPQRQLCAKLVIRLFRTIFNWPGNL